MNYITKFYYDIYVMAKQEIPSLSSILATLLS